MTRRLEWAQAPAERAHHTGGDRPGPGPTPAPRRTSVRRKQEAALPFCAARIWSCSRASWVWPRPS